MKKQAHFTALTLLLALVILTACQFTITPPISPLPVSASPTKGVVNVPFENVALNEWGVNPNMGQSPQLFVLLTASDVAQLQSLISAEAYQALQQIDWNNDAVIAVLRGVQGCSFLGVGIERVTVARDTLFVDAQFWQPPPHSLCQTILTSPYHLIKVHKAGLMLNRLTPVLRSRAVDKGDTTDQEQIGPK
ncbi:MAG: hypothetical protein NT075_31370 [Chloroflexi bacterium]|nr:hypothetical protein [Chloroflexota bacterium]